MSKNEAIQVTDAEWDVLDAIGNEPGQAAGRIIETRPTAPRLESVALAKGVHCALRRNHQGSNGRSRDLSSHRPVQTILNRICSRDTELAWRSSEKLIVNYFTMNSEH